MLLAADPEAQLDALYGNRTPLQLQLELDSAVLEDLKPVGSAGPPLSTGASVGLRLWRPALVDRGLRPVVLLALDGLHSFYDSGNTLRARASIGFEVWRFTLLVGTGFGLESLPSIRPRPVVPLAMSLAVHLGPVAIGLGYVREFQFESLSGFGNIVAIPGEVTVFVSRAFDLGD